MSSITHEQPSQAAEQAGRVGAACGESPTTAEAQRREAPVSLATRIATILISGEIILFAAKGENRLPELGLAFIFAGTLLATPSLIDPLVASRWFFAVYLRTVAMLAATGVILAVLGVRGGHINFAGRSWLEVGLLIVVAIAEVILLALAPLWFWITTKEAISKPKDQPSSESKGEPPVMPKSSTWHVCIEDKRVFAQLGALMFMAGVLMQFIAGSGRPETLHQPQVATHEGKSNSN